MESRLEIIETIASIRFHVGHSDSISEIGGMHER